MKKPFLIIALLWSSTTFAADVQGRVSLEGETFNFELSGQKNWDYDLKRIREKNQSKVQLFVKSVDQKLLDQIRNVENPFVKSIRVVPNEIDNKWLIEFVLKNDQVETFDYLTDQPSKLIVDFYKSENPVAETEEAAPAKPAKAAKSAAKKAKTVKERKPADVDILRIDDVDGIETSVLARSGLYDAGDSQFNRFTMKESDYSDESVLKSRGNYYLKFPVLESEFSFWKKMKENPPAYEIKPEPTDENKQARLLQTLFRKKRYLVFTQTAEWFKNKYPDSKYSEMIAFMTGDAYIELWRSEKMDSFYEMGQNAYREALEKYPDSILFERASLMTGMLSIDRQDFMSALRKLHAHINNKKFENKISKQYAKVGLAYSYSRINKVDEALKLLAEVEANTKDQLVLTETAVRRGDFYFFTKKLDDSIAAYDLAIKKFPLVSKLFPSAYFNKMEAQFWREQFKESHESGLGFTEHFPAHEFAPYALTRVGELLDIMGAAPNKSVGAFLETHFRYGDSPKTIVARLHLLSTKMKSMKKEELDQTLIKMDELAQKSELQNVDQFKVAMLADGFARRKEYVKAVDILSKFYQANPTRPDVKQVTNRIVKNINDELKNLADQGDYRNLLKTYRQYSDTWLKSHSRIDTDYFLGLSYANAGVYNVAIDKYKKVLDGMNSIKGTVAEKEARVNQYLPSTDSLYLKLSQSSYDNVSYQDAYQFLEKIENPLALSEEEQVDRVQLASRLYEKKGDSPTAIRYLKELSDLWDGDEKLSLPVQFRLAEMQVQKNDVSDAVETYEKCRETLMKNKKADKKDLSRLADSYGQLLLNQNKRDEAVGLLAELLEKHGSRFNFEQERYLLGDLYFKNGELKKAEQTWEQLPEQASNVWKQMATEKLKQAAWDVEYKKHLKRVPAVSQLEEEK